MRSTSSVRRAGGLLAATTVTFASTVLLGPGIAQAAAPTWVATASGIQAPIPAGICNVLWTVTGGGAGDSTPEGTGGEAGRVVAKLPADVGDVYTLHPGGVGGGASGSTPGAGGTSTDPDPGAQGLAGDTDGSAAGGGGGAASTVLRDGVAIISAYGADAWDPDGLGGHGGGGDVNVVDGLNWQDDIDTDGGPGTILGEGIPCMPAVPNLSWVAGLDSALRLHFSNGYDPVNGYGDVPTAGYEYTLDAGATWTALTGITDDFGLLSAVIDDLENGTEYTVQVRAVGGADTAPSAGSSPATGTPYKKATAPAGVKVVAADGKLTVRWSASTPGTYQVAGYVVDLVWRGDQHGGGTQFCTTGADVLTCTGPAQPGVTHDVRVYAVDAGERAGEATEVTSGVVPPSARVPEAQGTLTLPSGSSASVRAGRTITMSGSGYLPLSTVTLLIYSEPQILTTVVTDASGNFTVEVTVPEGLAAGQHTLVAAGLDPDGVMRYLTLPVTVTAGGTATVSGPVLARTGADLTLPAIGGLLAVVTGSALLVLARRRPAR